MTFKHWRLLAGCTALGLSSLYGAAADAPDLPPAPPQLGQAFPGPGAIGANDPQAANGLTPQNFATAPTSIFIDTEAARHPISPLIYGVAFASPAQLLALNAPLNRSGGNAITRYNWKDNSSNHANDWYYVSLPEDPPVPSGSMDKFVADSKAGGALPLLTIPTIGWVAKLGPNRGKTYSFSVAKYGPQQKTEPNFPDIGNGFKPDGKTKITGNDPNDANQPVGVEYQRPFIQHMIAKWGKSSGGGVRYYLMDNEPSLWNETHRDAHPAGDTMDEYRDDVINYGAMIKSIDPGVKILGPEEWGWPGYLWSGSDLAYRGAHNYVGQPDRDAHGGMAFFPWLLTQMRDYEKKTGHRMLDVATLHIYPQGGDGGDDISPKIEMLRNRSTRALWDPNYKDESWINEPIMLIPRMKSWVASSYPGTQIGITEYNWGAEKSMSGATAQADIFGIFGREGLDLATRWTTPDMATPTFKAMQMYRNYDGKKSGFGDLSVAARVPDPDTLASFAAIRRADGALTVMVINKSLTGSTPISLSVSHFAGAASAQAWQLSGTEPITRLPDASVSGGTLTAALPAQSVTLYVIPKGAMPR